MMRATNMSNKKTKKYDAGDNGRRTRVEKKAELAVMRSREEV